MSDPVRALDKHPFEYRTPTEQQAYRIKNVRQGCCDLLNIILANVRSTRERSLAITKLEEVSMWANKAIVFEAPTDQEIMARLRGEPTAMQPGE